MAERLANRVPETLKVLYKYHMRHINRWEGGPQRSLIPETNLDHVEAMHALAESVRSSYSTLAEKLDWDSIADMIDVHDGGEIGPGDLDRSDLEYENKVKRHKRREHLTFLFGSRRIADPNLRNDVLTTYWRFIKPEPSDIESNFAHLLDKVQALRFGIDNVFEGGEQNPVSRQHMRLGIGDMLYYAGRIRDHSTAEIRKDISAFVQLEIGRIKRNGFPETAQEMRAAFLKPVPGTVPFDHQLFSIPRTDKVS
jgi:5'-deoxynucleotidase YfbR-like HD superfamily hydrolase